MQKLRSLGWWQPFGSLMLPPYNKIETRIPSVNKKTGKERKLPFPLGPYLIYTTKKSTPDADLLQWCGPAIYHNIKSKLIKESTAELNGYAIGIGELVMIRDMKPEDEQQCFVRWKAVRDCLVFKNVYRIEPFEYKYGKQGPGFVPESEMDKIKRIL